MFSTGQDKCNRYSNTGNAGNRYLKILKFLFLSMQSQRKYMCSENQASSWAPIITNHFWKSWPLHLFLYNIMFHSGGQMKPSFSADSFHSPTLPSWPYRLACHFGFPALFLTYTLSSLWPWGSREADWDALLSNLYMPWLRGTTPYSSKAPLGCFLTMGYSVSAERVWRIRRTYCGWFMLDLEKALVMELRSLCTSLHIMMFGW